jgi:imidazolonepropionase-like amidohydrolase
MIQRLGWLFVAIAMCCGQALAAPEVPGRAPAHPVALVGGTLHPVSSPPIAGGVLVFDAGKIVAIGGPETHVPEGAERIDVAGRHVYPGLIECYSDLGLTEIDSVRGTLDQAETGAINPNVRAQVAFNPDSELVPVARSNGVLLAVTAPQGGTISGTSALMQLDGWTWEEMTVRAPLGLHVQWPRWTPERDWLSGSVDAPDAGARAETMKAIRQAVADARAYQAAREGAAVAGREAPFDARWEAMLPVLAGQIPLVVEADDAEAIQTALAFAAHERLRLVIHGGYDAPQCAGLLKRHDVPVIVAGTHRLPLRPSDPYDAPFTLPARLHEAGVRFAISGNEPAWNVRNLPYHAATAAGYGLPPEVALRSITLSAAEVLGVADRVGSLDVGKDATLLVSDGDPLEIATQVTAAWIAGRPVDLSNRQKKLYEKYLQKYAPSAAAGP